MTPAQLRILAPAIFAAAVAGCATAEIAPPRMMNIPPSLAARAELPEAPPPPVWPRHKNGRGVTVNATTTYDYEETRSYPIRICANFRSTYFFLQPGEKVTGNKLAVFGDPDETKWVLAGKEAGDTQIIAVMAKADDLHSSMLIATNRRAYPLELTSAKQCQTKVRFAYEPPPRLKLPARESEIFDPSRVRLNYQIELVDGELPAWLPIQVFDLGGTKTWIEFSDRPGIVGSPVVLIGGAGGGAASPAVVRTDGNFYEVDAPIIATAELKLHGSTVRISRSAS